MILCRAAGRSRAAGAADTVPLKYNKVALKLNILPTKMWEHIFRNHSRHNRTQNKISRTLACATRLKSLEVISHRWWPMAMRSHITRFAESPFRIFVLTARDLTARIHSFGRSGGSLRSASDLHVASSRARRRSAASPAESRDRRSEVAESSRGRRRLGSCQSRFKTRQHVNTPDGSSPGSAAAPR